MSIMDNERQKFTPIVNSVRDDEWVWLVGEGATGNTLPELWMSYLANAGYSVGTLHDRMFSFFGSLGHTGPLPQRYAKWLEVPAVPLTGFLSHDGDFSGFVSLEGDFSGSLSLEGNE